MDNDNINKLKENVLQVLKLNPNGVYQKTFEEKIPNLKAEQLLIVITELIRSSQIESITNKNSKEFFLKIKDSKILSLEKKLKQDEALVNRLIRDAGSKGVSLSIIKRNSKLKDNEILKIEKRLIDIGLIKIFYFNGQKIYVAIDTVPDSSLSEKLYVMEDKNSSESRIADLQNRILECLKRKHERAVEDFRRKSEQHRAAIITLDAILKFINLSSEKKISEKEIKLILDSLIYKEDIIQVEESSIIKSQFTENLSRDQLTRYVYRYHQKPARKLESIGMVPCISCPHKEYCCPGKEISPEKCQYLDFFLNCF